ncbi:MAG: hypothetical protein GF350_07625, partial [Chitinivibrionales bacterium]|nr:hypothetical protein [Chitinivibrionales bacterium]
MVTARAYIAPRKKCQLCLIIWTAVLFCRPALCRISIPDQAGDSISLYVSSGDLVEGRIIERADSLLIVLTAKKVQKIFTTDILAVRRQEEIGTGFMFRAGLALVNRTAYREALIIFLSIKEPGALRDSVNYFAAHCLQKRGKNKSALGYNYAVKAENDSLLYIATIHQRIRILQKLGLHKEAEACAHRHHLNAHFKSSHRNDSSVTRGIAGKRHPLRPRITIRNAGGYDLRENLSDRSANPQLAAYDAAESHSSRWQASATTRFSWRLWQSGMVQGNLLSSVRLYARFSQKNPEFLRPGAGFGLVLQPAPATLHNWSVLYAHGIKTKSPGAQFISLTYMLAATKPGAHTRLFSLGITRQIAEDSLQNGWFGYSLLSITPPAETGSFFRICGMITGIFSHFPACDLRFPSLRIYADNISPG